MWGFCGADHYAEDAPNNRFRFGYRRENAPDEERTKDLNRQTWIRKFRHRRTARYDYPPGEWLAGPALRHWSSTGLG